jgi:hypothetical protein
VVLLEVRLRLALVPLGQGVVEQRHLVLHVRTFLQIDGLDDHVVNQVRHTPHRVVGPGPPLYHTGSPDAPIAVAPTVSS